MVRREQKKEEEWFCTWKKADSEKGKGLETVMKT
jgi:hypothetical protein